MTFIIYFYNNENNETFYIVNYFTFNFIIYTCYAVY